MELSFYNSISSRGSGDFRLANLIETSHLWVSSKPGKSALKTFLLHQALHCI